MPSDRAAYQVTGSVCQASGMALTECSVIRVTGTACQRAGIACGGKRLIFLCGRAGTINRFAYS